MHEVLVNRLFNRGAQADRFDHHKFRKGLQQGPTQEAITQTRLLWDTSVHPQVDQLLALWAQSTSSFMLFKQLLLAAIWPTYRTGNWAIRYHFIVKTLRYII